MNDLQTTLLTLINKESFELKDLQVLLGPAPIDASNELLSRYAKDIINIVTKDRNNNQKFDIGDLELLSKDIVGITSLVTSILLLLNTLPNVKFEYKEGQTEELIFKIIVYLFLVILPQHTNLKLSIDERVAILNLCILVYTFLIQSEIVKQLTKKIAGWVKKQFFYCLATSQTLLEQKSPSLLAKMSVAVSK